MDRTFSSTLSSLRKAKGISQRKVAADLNISQALLSHYENGAREPGLNFVCRACEYFEVTADYMLGRVEDEMCLAVNKNTISSLVSKMHELIECAEETLKEIK